MHFYRTFHRAFLFSAALVWAGTATAQWQWLDKDGRKVFSDRSPPAEVRDKDILKRPAGAARPVAAAAASAEPAQGQLASAAATAGAPGAKPGAPKISGKDTELEAKKKLAEAEEAAKKKAEEEKLALVKADNCARARKGLATFESGVRIATTNAKGEREVMDDKTRAIETKRLQDTIASDCV